MASSAGSLTVRMPLAGSGLDWVSQRPLGVVSDRTCSSELGEPFRGWSVLRQPSRLQNPGGREGETGSFLGSMTHCPVAINCMHQQTLVHRYHSGHLCPIVPQHEEEEGGDGAEPRTLNAVWGTAKGLHLTW